MIKISIFQPLDSWTINSADKAQIPTTLYHLAIQISHLFSSAVLKVFLWLWSHHIDIVGLNEYHVVSPSVVFQSAYRTHACIEKTHHPFAKKNAPKTAKRKKKDLNKAVLYLNLRAKIGHS